MSNVSTSKPIKLGVFGIKRGTSFADVAASTGFELTAICDYCPERLEEAGKKYDVATYSNFDDFIKHDMDAVVMANYFTEHAPYAVRALESGKHVISETSACITMAEGVKLARTVEKTGLIYLFAENYPYNAFNQEMKRLYDLGEIGELQYGEGEYIHPGTAAMSNNLAPGIGHWRNNIPATYYCTHSVAPLVYITGNRPVSVNALCIPYSEKDEQKLHVRRNDTASVILCRLENDAVIRLLQVRLRGGGSVCRLHGTRGMMERTRYGGSYIRIAHEDFDMKQGDVKERFYTPEFPVLADKAKKSGHGGGDFYTMYYFSDAIIKKEQPFFNVYRGLDMTFVGIQGYKSALANGAPFEIPDFRDEDVRKKYEKDDWSALPQHRKPGQPWPSIKGEIIPSEESVKYAEELWSKMKDIVVD